MERLKNIRFNLRFFNGEDTFEAIHSVKELEEKLRGNEIAFDDLMSVFLCGQLDRWLECHGEKDRELLDKLRAIKREAPNKEVVKSLFEALGFDFEEKELDRMIISYEFPQRLKEVAAESDKVRDDKIRMLKNETDAYEAICGQLAALSEDWVGIRKCAKNLLDRYYPLIRIDIGRFYSAFKKKCPFVILALLMEKDGRELFEQTAINSNASMYPIRLPSLENYFCFEGSWATKRFYISIGGEENYLENPYPIDWIEDYSKAETSYLELLQKPGRVLILNNSGVYVRGVEDGCEDSRDWDDGELNGKFKILSNCSYRLKHKTKAFLAYVEL